MLHLNNFVHPFCYDGVLRSIAPVSKFCSSNTPGIRSEETEITCNIIKSLSKLFEPITVDPMMPLHFNCTFEVNMTRIFLHLEIFVMSLLNISQFVKRVLSLQRKLWIDSTHILQPSFIRS